MLTGVAAESAEATEDPQTLALRAFARVFVCFHGWFVGSYYAWVAGAGNSRWFDLTTREERGYPT